MLESGRGARVEPARPAGRTGIRRPGLVAGGALLGVSVVAAGAWAGYSMFFATGPQAAEALPAATVGYVSVDLDPSGQQKLEALRTLRKFPAFVDNVDLVQDDDLRLALFEAAQGDGAVPTSTSPPTSNPGWATASPWRPSTSGPTAPTPGLVPNLWRV